ncbi:MAG: hypothetical protein ABJQ70_14140 [Roseobacter sp.]
MIDLCDRIAVAILIRSFRRVTRRAALRRLFLPVALLSVDFRKVCRTVSFDDLTEGRARFDRLQQVRVVDLKQLCADLDHFGSDP